MKSNKREQKLVFAWHVHHDMLIEGLKEPIGNRIDYIKKHKPQEEVKLRLRLLKRVKGRLPGKLVRASNELNKAELKWEIADAVWHNSVANLTQREVERIVTKAGENTIISRLNKTKDERNEARARLIRAESSCKTELMALHKLECLDCPWNGRTIFTYKDEQGEWC